MPYVQIGRKRVNYGLHGEDGRDVIVFINGLTQSTSLWTSHQERLTEQGFRVLTYDTLGQGLSSKPVLGIRLEDHGEVLCALLDALKIDSCYLAGISFGGVVAMHTAIHHPERVKGLVVMSAFSEMPAQLEMLGRCMHMAITQAGFPLIQSLLLPMNFSSQWLERAKATLSESMRRSYANNDSYAIQNLMESYINFRPFTKELPNIQCPALILNGEFDYLTPRLCHDVLRKNIKSSRLMVVPNAYHAFTLEYPHMTVRLIADFVQRAANGSWQGDQSVWVANDDVTSDILATRFVGDHLRAIQQAEIGTQAQDDTWFRNAVDPGNKAPASKPAKTKAAAPRKSVAKPEKAAPPAKPAASKPAKAKPATAAKKAPPPAESATVSSALAASVASMKKPRTPRKKVNEHGA